MRPTFPWARAFDTGLSGLPYCHSDCGGALRLRCVTGRCTTRTRTISKTADISTGGGGFIVGEGGQKPLPLRVAQLPRGLELLVLICRLVSRGGDGQHTGTINRHGHELVGRRIGAISSVLRPLSLGPC